MEKPKSSPTFLDAWCENTNIGGKRTTQLLEQLDLIIPWEEIAKPIRDTFLNNSGKGGRPSNSVIMMVKCVFLQKLYNLSDPGIEEALYDRFSFRKFVGLHMNDQPPDETSFVRFRERLREHGLADTLFEIAKDHLDKQGLILKEGTAVDATIISAPRGKNTNDGLGHTSDRCATTTFKHGRVYHGYKAHIAVDLNGMITDYLFDTAKVHDSIHMDRLIRNEKVAVFGDSAYMNKERKNRLEENGIFCGIIERRVRGQDALTNDQKHHNSLCARFRAIVESPFAWIKNTGGFLRVRYRGLQRNALDFCLVSIVMNFKRSLSLLRDIESDNPDNYDLAI